MRRYTEKMEKGRFTDFARGEKTEITPEWARKATYLHRYVYTKIDASMESGSYIQTPEETLEKGQGDCQDQGVLLANMYVDAGFDVRLARIRDNENGNNHITLQVHLPGDCNDAYKVLEEVYENHYPVITESNFAWSEVRDGEFFFFADPMWSNFVGNKDQMIGKMIHQTLGWSFYEVKEDHVIEANRRKAKP